MVMLDPFVQAKHSRSVPYIQRVTTKGILSDLSSPKMHVLFYGGGGRDCSQKVLVGTA